MEDVGSNKKKNDQINKKMYQCGDEETSASTGEKRKEASKSVSFNLPLVTLTLAQLTMIQLHLKPKTQTVTLAGS